MEMHENDKATEGPCITQIFGFEKKKTQYAKVTLVGL